MVKTRFAIAWINTHCYYSFIAIPIGIDNDKSNHSTRNQYYR